MRLLQLAERSLDGRLLVGGQLVAVLFELLLGSEDIRVGGANAIGLKNVTFRHARAEEEKQLFDFVVSRAVMPLGDLIKIIKKNISPRQQNALPNGLICLKGGELEHEAMPFKNKTTLHSLSEDFEEEFFQTKKVVYVTV